MHTKELEAIAFASGSRGYDSDKNPKKKIREVEAVALATGSHDSSL